ncbi:hypothetical protein PV328_010307 [Microctonus aethiopoides]|uniref:Uncharacterized protein n=1 Tax=Microctonus aethiopoides TaxID=144406 RepID=A0AA39C7M8_9HYME|nr:hypothetical protein PV328_010307 [Microctonus aethiopoides]
MKKVEDDMTMAYTALSISVKMASGPNNHQEEPTLASDEIQTTSDTNPSNIIIANNNENENIDTNDVTIDANSNPEMIASIDKQEEPATFSTLNEGELETLLKEVLTYRGSTREREEKSSLFKELLRETEVEETEEGRCVVANSRCIPGSNRRRHKRDSVSERLTHGGSLQNLAQPINSEFDSSFAYLTSGSSHTYGGNRRKTNKKHSGPSVSARQREGGSLPSNVNASHSLASLVNLDLIFDKKRGFCAERTVYDWTNKEKSKSLDKPSYGCVTKKEDKEREKKDSDTNSGSSSGSIVCNSNNISNINSNNNNNNTNNNNVIVTNAIGCLASNIDITDNKKKTKIKQTSNEMLESDNPPPDYKPDYMVIDIEVNGLSERSAVSNSSLNNSQRQQHDDNTVVDDGEGTEMKTIEPRRPMQLISRATFDTVDMPVDTTIEFPLREHIGNKPDKGKITISGTLQLTTYNNAKCNITNGVNAGGQTGKVTGSSLLPIVHVSGNVAQPNIAMAVSRITAQNATTKDFSVSIDKKSLDENGNAVQGHNGGSGSVSSERKKSRRKHAQEPNVIVYKAENVEGHRGHHEDIDSLINFIENKDSKSKKGKTTSSGVRMKTSAATKSRSRDKDIKREQLPVQLHKSNSLEEVSKTKLEDLTAEKSISSSSAASSVSSQHGAINGGTLRRAKQRSTGDSAADCRGDRRSWGTEEGQSIYCNDIGNEYTTATSAMRRNTNRKINVDTEHEPEFLVVTKKKKSKRQRRSSSGSRAQNLTSSSSYLPRARDFTHEYHTPLSPEMRRKSTSSMPPSDKSDSSDLDSIHSLPVTSNTKHDLSKNAVASVGAPQASYADIARMATINVSPNSVIHISASMVPNMLNTGNWPAVPGKSPSEPDKFPQDYYPSLDELQQSDRKFRQQNFANSNHAQEFSLSFDKVTSPTNSKLKIAAESKKAEAREEAINKKIQVIKYVQEQKNLNANVNYNVNQTNNNQANNSIPFKMRINSANNDSNSSADDTSSEILCSKDCNANVRIVNYQRSIRRNYQQISAPIQNIAQQLENPDGKKSLMSIEELKKLHNPQDDTKKFSIALNMINVVSTSQAGDQEVEVKFKPVKPKGPSTSQHNQSEYESVMPSSAATKVEKISKSTAKESPSQSANTSTILENTKSTQYSRDEQVESIKRTSKYSVNKDTPKCKDSHINIVKKNSRPAVILLDESDPTRNHDFSSELTFGFAVNEQLLKSDDSDTQKIDEIYVTTEQQQRQQIFMKSSTTFDRPPPPMYDKNVRYDKFPTNFHAYPPPNPYHHQLPHPSMIVSSMPPFIGYSQRFQPQNAFMPPSAPSSIIDKYYHHHHHHHHHHQHQHQHQQQHHNQQPKEDFCARYVAPEEAVNVHNYNHDKIVTFVGQAWDAVMREIPVTATTGRVQYYSGQ